MEKKEAIFSMISELDRIKSTITISLGTKNRLRDLKGSMSYEDFINQLIRMKKGTAQNVVQKDGLSKSHRTNCIYPIGAHRIFFSYNQFSNSPEFVFDVRIDNVMQDGQSIDYSNLEAALAKAQGMDTMQVQSGIYFRLLIAAIRKEIEPMFKHNGRIEDYYSWAREFEVLNIPKSSFTRDIMEKLDAFNKGQRVFK